MNEARSAADIRAEIARLTGELLSKGEDANAQELEIGQIHNLSVGQAEIVGFYEEDGMYKVRAILKPFAPGDGCTPDSTRESLFSTPVARFRKLISEFQKDCAARQALEARLSSRFHFTKGKTDDHA